ncbi:sortase B protein-sorting domain-containing protein [Laceyella putida]|uniref:Sortase B protein-sorting domain-containing protein n=1 Tax=Laceyella putida TaxID=110101 RepID=A0ABW2RR17_9BACL
MIISPLGLFLFILIISFFILICKRKSEHK